MLVLLASASVVRILQTVFNGMRGFPQSVHKNDEIVFLNFVYIITKLSYSNFQIRSRTPHSY